MLTLEQLNINEQELDQALNFIYESGDHPEKDMYIKFIKEDATLDQKMALMMNEIQDPNKQGHIGKAIASVAGRMFGPFWLAYRLIRAFTEKCSRKCKVIGTNTFIRQQCMAKCNAQEGLKAAAAAAKIKCSGDASCEEKKKEMVKKYKSKAAEAQNKYERYKEKHKKLAFTV